MPLISGKNVSTRISAYQWGKKRKKKKTKHNAEDNDIFALQYTINKLL